MRLLHMFEACMYKLVLHASVQDRMLLLHKWLEMQTTGVGEGRTWGEPAHSSIGGAVHGDRNHEGCVHHKVYV